MIGPLMVVSLAVALTLTVTAFVLGRRTSDQPGDESLEPAREVEQQQRYVNGGWH